MFLVHALDRAVEAGERAVDDLDLLADVEADGGLGTLDALFHGADDVLDLTFRDRQGLGAARRAQEAGDLRRVLDQVIGLVRHLHLHQHIAWEEFAFRVHLAATTDLDDVLGRNQDFGEGVFQALLLGLIAQLLGDLLFEVRIGVDDVPLVARIGGLCGRCIGHGRVFLRIRER